MRTLENFENTFKESRKILDSHNKPFWLAPTKDDYALSVIRPKPRDLPKGTCANLHSIELDIIDFVESSE